MAMRLRESSMAASLINSNALDDSSPNVTTPSCTVPIAKPARSPQLRSDWAVAISTFVPRIQTIVRPAFSRPAPGAIMASPMQAAAWTSLATLPPM